MQVVEAIAATFTRPNDTTAYTSGDLVANNTTAGSVVPLVFQIPYGRGFKLWRASIQRSTTTVTAAQFRLHLYRDSPVPVNGDNGAWSTPASTYVGFIDIDGTSPAFSAGAKAFGSASSVTLYIVTDPDQQLFGLLEARAAYAPGAQETFAVTLLGEAYV